MYLTNPIYPNIVCTVIYRPKKKKEKKQENIEFVNTKVQNNVSPFDFFNAQNCLQNCVLFNSHYSSLQILAFVTSIIVNVAV